MRVGRTMRVGRVRVTRVGDAWLRTRRLQWIVMEKESEFGLDVGEDQVPMPSWRLLQLSKKDEDEDAG